jgi:hypothetical protein
LHSGTFRSVRRAFPTSPLDFSAHFAIGTVPVCGYEQFVFRPALPGKVFAGRPHTPQVAFLDLVEIA